MNEASRHQIDLLHSHSVQSIFKGDDRWKLDTNQGNFTSKKLVIASGSNPKIWELLKSLEHKIVTPVPSLFTFNINDKSLTQLMGISSNASVKIVGTKLNSQGAVLITHWGVSGPAILRLSAWGARDLATLKYSFDIEINWRKEYSTEETLDELKEIRDEHSKKKIGNTSCFGFANRMWQVWLQKAEISADTKWADISNSSLLKLSHVLCKSSYKVNGKSTFKEEFVTAGGVELKEINFKSMESKLLSDLYFAGEVINIDAITGGFNFQNAWTTGYLAAQHISRKE